jgi:hypothetical protein
MINYKITVLQLLKISSTKKHFCFFNVDENNRIKGIKLTNDISRYRKQYTNFRDVNILKKQINNITII